MTIKFKKLVLSTVLYSLFVVKSLAQTPQETKTNPAYYVKSKGYSSVPETDPPRYVKQLDKTGIEIFKDIDWIDAGLNYRVRFEHRDNDFRRTIDRTDNPVLSRTQGYFAIKNILDPLRFAIEIQDSRRHNSKFASSTGDINKLDLFQGYGELHFKNPLFIDRPISLRAGRMAFEVLDRKLLARDDWGNTGTNFQGFRAIIGKQENDWQFDSFALQPVIKNMDENDHRNKNRWIYGSILNLRKWSKDVTLQPFYFMLDQKKSDVSEKRLINSPGMRLYGTFGNNKFDYDIISVYQFGDSGEETHRAYAYSTEVGYTHNHILKPRFSLIYGYASGDKNPNDSKNQRFERFYGFNRPWSNNNHIEWENLETIKSRIEFLPHKKISVNASYSYYWLASSTDQWKRGNLRDKSGTSGDLIGQDFDLRASYQVTKNISGTTGFAYFKPGEFTKNNSRDNSSYFIYSELIFSIF